MQNQKLFDKIRESLTDDTQPALDWNQASVWERIEERRRPRRRAFVWWVAAASVVLLLGGWWLLSDPNSYTQKSQSATIKNAPLANFPKAQVEQVGRSKAPLPHPSLVKAQIVQQQPAFQQVTDTVMLKSKPQMELQIAENQTVSPMVMPDSSVREVEVFAPQEAVAEALVKPKERVLIVDIDLPDAPQNPANEQLRTSFLERFGKEIKHSRTHRKFDLRALDRRPGKGGWSLIAHSLIVPQPK